MNFVSALLARDSLHVIVVVVKSVRYNTQSFFIQKTPLFNAVSKPPILVGLGWRGRGGGVETLFQMETWDNCSML